MVIGLHHPRFLRLVSAGSSYCQALHQLRSGDVEVRFWHPKHSFAFGFTVERKLDCLKRHEAHHNVVNLLAVFESSVRPCFSLAGFFQFSTLPG